MLTSYTTAQYSGVRKRQGEIYPAKPPPPSHSPSRPLAFSHSSGDSRIRTCIAWLFKPPLYRWSYIPSSASTHLGLFSKFVQTTGLEPMTLPMQDRDVLPLNYVCIGGWQSGLEPCSPRPQRGILPVKLKPPEAKPGIEPEQTRFAVGYLDHLETTPDKSCGRQRTRPPLSIAPRPGFQDRSPLRCDCFIFLFRGSSRTRTCNSWFRNG